MSMLGYMILTLLKFDISTYQEKHAEDYGVELMHLNEKLQRLQNRAVRAITKSINETS